MAVRVVAPPAAREKYLSRPGRESLRAHHLSLSNAKMASLDFWIPLGPAAGGVVDCCS